jgi:MarR family transcriptional regulator, negative regulator of the multidrug operon emrRAB
MHTPDDERLLNLLGALAVGLGDRIGAATEATLGESPTTVAALVTVAQGPGCSIEELRHTLGLSHSATVRVVDRLVARGLVARGAGARGPAVALVATAAGRRLAVRVLDVRNDVVREVAGEALPGDLAGALETLLDRLTVDPPTGHRICRLCDFETCPTERCPVAVRQLAQGEPPQAAVTLR